MVALPLTTIESLFKFSELSRELSIQSSPRYLLWVLVGGDMPWHSRLLKRPDLSYADELKRMGQLILLVPDLSRIGLKRNPGWLAAQAN